MNQINKVRNCLTIKISQKRKLPLFPAITIWSPYRWPGTTYSGKT